MDIKIVRHDDSEVTVHLPAFPFEIHGNKDDIGRVRWSTLILEAQCASKLARAIFETSSPLSFRRGPPQASNMPMNDKGNRAFPSPGSVFDEAAKAFGESRDHFL